MKKTKEATFQMRASDEFIRRLNKAAQLLEKPGSQIVREAVNEKLAELAKQYPELQAA